MDLWPLHMLTQVSIAVHTQSKSKEKSNSIICRRQRHFTYNSHQHVMAVLQILNVKKKKVYDKGYRKQEISGT